MSQICQSFLENSFNQAVTYAFSKMSNDANYENPDLKKERLNCPFDKEEITNFIDGGIEKTKERRELGKKQLLTTNHLL